MNGTTDKTVLMIEDEPNILEAVRFILSRDGWRVLSHANGADAMDVIEDRRPDLLILDVMLPNRSGYEILKDLRSQPDFEALPVLMLTARGQSKDREIAAAAGASHFMTKPFSNAEVLDVVRRLAGHGAA
ncbi:response regulator transcription factor [Algirhabdus cladophorae]|uniref:response regulator transcription factor n=1 Tax=Algirhabdus cladophorae TaxID=3377108 RepID=UPI003B849550